MAKNRELNRLPSVTGDDKDGTKKGWNSLSEEEKGRLRESICKRISEKLSVYYSVHQEEWEEFTKIIPQEKE